MAAMTHLTGPNGGDGEDDGVPNVWASPSDSHGGGTLRACRCILLRCFRRRDLSAGPGLSDLAPDHDIVMGFPLPTTSAMGLLIGHGVGDEPPARSATKFVSKLLERRLSVNRFFLSITSGSPMWGLNDSMDESDSQNESTLVV